MAKKQHQVWSTSLWRGANIKSHILCDYDLQGADFGRKMKDHSMIFRMYYRTPVSIENGMNDKIVDVNLVNQSSR